MKVIRFLVIRSGGDMRIAKRRPVLNWDEVLFRLVVTVPDSWGKVAGDINLTVPEGAVSIESAEWVEPEEVSHDGGAVNDDRARG